MPQPTTLPCAPTKCLRYAFVERMMDTKEEGMKERRMEELGRKERKGRA
jgi:hypothetical protein